MSHSNSNILMNSTEINSSLHMLSNLYKFSLYTLELGPKFKTICEELL